MIIIMHVLICTMIIVHACIMIMLLGGYSSPCFIIRLQSLSYFKISSPLMQKHDF